MRPSEVELHVEELVLEGFASGDGARIGAAVQRELARLLSAQAVPAALSQAHEVDVVHAGQFGVPTGAASEAIGARIARAVYGGLTR